MYRGAGYYSLRNEGFRYQFITNVSGAKVAIDTVNKLENTFIGKIKETVEIAVRVVREGGEKAIESLSKNMKVPMSLQTM